MLRIGFVGTGLIALGACTRSQGDDRRWRPGRVDRGRPRSARAARPGLCGDRGRLDDGRRGRRWRGGSARRCRLGVHPDVGPPGRGGRGVGGGGAGFLREAAGPGPGERHGAGRGGGSVRRARARAASCCAARRSSGRCATSWRAGSLGAPMAAVFRDDQYFPIRGTYASQWRADVAQAGGGCLIEHSIHDVDILRFCFGEVDGWRRGRRTTPATRASRTWPPCPSHSPRASRLSSRASGTTS